MSRNSNKIRHEASAPFLAKKLCSCIKKVRKTVKLSKGRVATKSSREQAAIGICVKSVIQQRKTRRRTLRRFTCRKNKPVLITQTAL